MIALRRDDPDRALVLLSAANKAQPNDTRVLYALGFAYLGRTCWHSPNRRSAACWN